MVIKPTISYRNEKSSIKIDEKDSFIELVMEIYFKNPYDKNIDAVKIIAVCTGEIKFEVKNDFKIYGSIDHVDTRIIDFEPYF